MVLPTRIDPSSDLFAAAALPSGLSYESAFLSVDEEAQLVEAVRDLPLAPADYRGFTARRRIASFGASYDFSARQLQPAPAMPAFLWRLRDRVAARLQVPPERVVHALVTEYAIGTPLGWHRDTPEFEEVAGVSLTGECEMRWRRYPPRRGAATLKLLLAPRSLYLMRGEARWGWQHSIAATRELRYSITLRTLRPVPGSLVTKA
jgi:alkylated DNA repair dioxygenase AlkB